MKQEQATDTNPMFSNITTTNNGKSHQQQQQHNHTMLTTVNHSHHHNIMINNTSTPNGNSNSGSGSGSLGSLDLMTTITTTATNNNNNNECTVREQDRFMPIANVIRIMRKILPPHAKISDDAKETIQECVSEYISFITGEANERCQREQRKTITAEDVLWAMSKLGFDDYVDPLTLYLHRYRELEGERGATNTAATNIIRTNTTTTAMKGGDVQASYAAAAAAAYPPSTVMGMGSGGGVFMPPPPPMFHMAPPNHHHTYQSSSAAGGGYYGHGYMKDPAAPHNIHQLGSFQPFGSGGENKHK